ncbi:MAG: hypothetical protein ABSA93_09610 [Streptosporangiaceae bacterium]|jgi:hypothetical protein
MAIDDTYTMPCGQDPLTVADRARAGQTDAHEQACPYCQAAIAEAGLTLRAAQELAAQAVDVPPTLLPAVMRTVWSELRPSATIDLPVPSGGAVVTTLAITAALRHDLDQLPGLTVRSCRADAAGPPSHDGTGAPLLAIRITATATWPTELPALASEARRLVSGTLQAQFGLDAASIDINFTDLDFPRAAS